MNKKSVPFTLLPDEAFVRADQFPYDLIPQSSFTIRRWVKSGHFPKPYRLGPSTVAWRVGEIRAWLASRQHASSDDGAQPNEAAKTSVKVRAENRAKREAQKAAAA
jgi:predicted DNA-binding transcriptional regulator AlpA